MSEENQDTEMEDILSSIKNILEEDEQARNNATRDDLAVEADVLGDVLNSSSEVDDVLELSPDMRLTETENVVDSPVVPVNETEAEAEVNPLQEIESLATDSVDNLLADETLLSTDETLPKIDSDNEESDAFYAATPTVVEPLIEEISQPVEKKIEETEPFFEQVDEQSAEPLAEQTPFFEQNAEPDVVVEPETEPEPEPEVIVEPESEPEPVAVVENAVDASANIISNFAKMFSQSENHANETSVNTPITSAGDTGKTLEEFVLESITKVIGKEISNQWNGGAEYKSFAEAEIIRQTQEWINDNLPMLVEKVVKQEIERVIAKVGS